MTINLQPDDSTMTRPGKTCEKAPFFRMSYWYVIEIDFWRHASFL